MCPPSPPPCKRKKKKEKNLLALWLWLFYINRGFGLTTRTGKRHKEWRAQLTLCFSFYCVVINGKPASCEVEGPRTGRRSSEPLTRCRSERPNGLKRLTTAANREVPLLIWTKACLHTAITVYVTIYPSVGVTLPLLLFFWGGVWTDVYPGACTLTLHCLHQFIYGGREQHNIFIYAFLLFLLLNFCYFFHLVWWFQLHPQEIFFLSYKVWSLFGVICTVSRTEWTRITEEGGGGSVPSLLIRANTSSNVKLNYAWWPPHCLWKRLQRVANADADVAEWLWKLLHTASRNEACRQPLQKKPKQNNKQPWIRNIRVPLLEETLLLLHPTISDLHHTPSTRSASSNHLPNLVAQTTPRDRSAVAGCSPAYTSAFTGRRLQWIIMKISKATNKPGWRSSRQASRLHRWNPNGRREYLVGQNWILN